MKVKVVRSFIDKYTGKNHPLDEVFEVNDKRYAEIKKAGHYVDVVAMPKKATKIADK